MKTTVNFWDFCDAFRNCDRNENFSYDGKRALFDWLEDLEADIGEESELDVIALCCDFTEYENLKAFQSDYSKDYETIEDIESETTVIRIDDSDSFIIQCF
jgi:hypothetical protein